MPRLSTTIFTSAFLAIAAAGAAAMWWQSIPEVTVGSPTRDAGAGYPVASVAAPAMDDRVDHIGMPTPPTP